MPWNNANIETQQVIVSGESDGVFVYNGTPAAGNLIASIASLAGIDAFGNNYGAGVNIGNQSAAHAGIDTTGRIFLFNSADQQIFDLSGFDGGLIAKDTIGNIQAVFSGGSAPFGLIGPATAWKPGSTGVTPETWHPMSLLNSWLAASGGTPPQYRMVASPVNTVEVVGSVVAPSGLSGTSIIWDVPTGYQISHRQPLVARNQSTNAAVMLSCSAGAGMLSYQAGASAGDTVDFHGFFSVDA